MAKNIEMSVLGSDGSYEVLYPYTIPSQVEDLLNNDTKVYIGLNEDSTPDDAFRSLYLLNVLQGKIALTLTVKDSATGTPIEGVQIACSSYCDAKGNPIAGPIETNSEGKIDVFCSVSNPTLSISDYFDIIDYSQQFSYELGNSYSAEWNVTTRNFLKMTSSTNKMFSPNVNRIDVTCVGGGGGGASGNDSGNGYSGGGGGGGYCVIQENINFIENLEYQLVVGAGGIGGISGLAHGRNATDGGNSSFLNLVANGGKAGITYNAGEGNGNGGAGFEGSAFVSSRNGLNGGNGNTYGYSSFTETVLYGGGGGGGAYGNSRVAGQGGLGYGGDGGIYITPLPTNGENGYGGGGGGHGGVETDEFDSSGLPGGNGGSGCVAMRMHLKTAV